MCANCGVNANCRTTSALTWAIPVDVAKLGASLQAYHSLKPIITHFRLCNRFGQGPDVFLTRLPQELVDMVLEFLIIPARQVQEVEWNLVKGCAEHRCDPRDHYTEMEIEDIKDEFRWNLRIDIERNGIELSDHDIEVEIEVKTEGEKIEAHVNDMVSNALYHLRI
jgi:hypothetical protein